jgi:hypothetical protein
MPGQGDGIEPMVLVTIGHSYAPQENVRASPNFPGFL